MVVAEIVKTCSHAKIAKAALASIGGDFPGRVSAAAGRRGLEPGVFAAQAVKEFDRQAGVLRRRELERALVRTDMPVLHGLRLILEDALDRAR